MQIEFVSEHNLDVIRNICLDPSVDKKTRVLMENAMEERLSWIKKMIPIGLKILVAYEKPRNEVIQYKWVGKIRHSDLAVQGRVPMGLLESIPIEHVLEPIEGKDSLFINCMWILPPFWKMGIGAALLKSFIDEARNYGGASIISYDRDKWFGTSINYLPASFFKKFGFQEVDRDGTRILLHLDLGSSTPPSFIPYKPHYSENKEIQGLEIYFNSQCPWARYMVNSCMNHFKNVPNIKVDLINTNEREIIKDKGISRGICLNGKAIIKRMASLGEINQKIKTHRE